MQQFSARLASLMNEYGTSQYTLGKAIGVARQSIAQYLDGKTQPNAEKICAIADYFQVSSDYLLGRVDCRSADIDLQSICKKTGLSEEAIMQLQEGFFSNKQASGLLNELIVLQPFHECITYMQTTFDLFDSAGKKTSRTFDNGKVTLSGEYASVFFRRSAQDKYSEAFSLMELLRRKKEYLAEEMDNAET